MTLALTAALYRSALELDPKKAFAHYGLGVTYVSTRRYEAALAALDRAIEWKPTYADTIPSGALAWAPNLSSRPRVAATQLDIVVRTAFSSR